MFLLRQLFEQRAEAARETISEEDVDGVSSEMDGEAPGRKHREVR